MGFTNHVFVSWPHLLEERGKDIVRELGAALKDKFNSEGGGVVFIDDRIAQGEDWNLALRRNVCRSGILIAFVVRSYYKSDYCAIEWHIADKLQERRLPQGSTQKAIIPILLTDSKPHARQVLKLQYSSDFLPLITFSQSLKSHPRWLELVDKLAKHIMRVLELVSQRQPDWATEEAMSTSIQAIEWEFESESIQAAKLPVLVVEEPTIAR